MTKQQSPWASGPGEILRHGLDLLKRDTDTNRRLAMILIDNAVELMVKTYLGLPRRITGLTITRKEFADASETFPGLLDGLEKHAADKLDGIDLGAIEWYHRLRNELYHQGNGLTVERDKVEIYAELANLLFKNLYGFELVAKVTPRAELFGEFMSAWVDLERGLNDAARRASQDGKGQSGLIQVMRLLGSAGLLDQTALTELNELRRIRNEAVHGVGDAHSQISTETVARVRHFSEKFAATGQNSKDA